MALSLPASSGKIATPRRPSLLAASLAAAVLAAPLPASATLMHVTVDTAGLSGTAFLAFDFYDGDTASNGVTISEFATDGTLGAATTQGGAGGRLSPPPKTVTLTDSALFNEFLQGLTLGTTLSFTLNLTEAAPVSSLPDSFAFFLLDAASMPLFDTTDPTGAGALFAVDIDGSPDGALSIFGPVDPAGNLSWRVTPAAPVPLPSTAWLMGAILLGAMAVGRRRRP